MSAQITKSIATYESVNDTQRYKRIAGKISGIADEIRIGKPFKINPSKRQRVIETIEKTHVTGLRFIERNRSLMYGDLLDESGKPSLLIAYRKRKNGILYVELFLYIGEPPTLENAKKRLRE